MDAKVRLDKPGSYNRNEKRRQAKQCLEGKLKAAYKHIRELELRLNQLQSSHTDPVVAEVEGRLGLVRPMLSTLVAAGQASSRTNASGSLRAFRNFGMHADMGCGVDNLPKDSAEAKRRVRGARKVSAQGDSSFNERFKQALACCSASDVDSSSGDNSIACDSDPQGEQRQQSLPHSVDQLSFLAGLIADTVSEQLQTQVPQQVLRGCESNTQLKAEHLDAMVDGLHKHLQGVISKVSAFADRENLSRLPATIEDLHATLRNMTRQCTANETAACQYQAILGRLEALAVHLDARFNELAAARDTGLPLDSACEKGPWQPQPALPITESAAQTVEVHLVDAHCQTGHSGEDPICDKGATASAATLGDSAQVQGAEATEASDHGLDRDRAFYMPSNAETAPDLQAQSAIYMIDDDRSNADEMVKAETFVADDTATQTAPAQSIEVGVHSGTGDKPRWTDLASDDEYSPYQARDSVTQTKMANVADELELQCAPDMGASMRNRKSGDNIMEVSNRSNASYDLQPLDFPQVNCAQVSRVQVHSKPTAGWTMHWKLLASKCFTGDVVYAQRELPSFAQIRQTLDVQEAALRIQTWQRFIQDLDSIQLDSELAQLILKTLAVAQLPDPNMTPAKLLRELATDLIQHARLFPDHHLLLRRAVNCLDRLCPNHPIFTSETLVTHIPEIGRTRRKR
eukprot:TRINITY_DN16194_c0_g1_i1.p1 TRINITY_DN16194_c0_g1~~TRINITY_DN16194_c0_g1_i1.p1  ORF type:complete len:717 (+),score=103.79 TRINITY_DN16194_c0_g1_i1:92-2152(+)